ncbi:MAG TPA: OmpA family protein [Flavipsychrobacter sp.]|nr:OmpA family protein [Flavipsychrobacter sp.]
MSDNIIDLVKQQIPRDFIKNAADHFSESQDSIKKVINTGVPAILSGLLMKAETTEGAGFIHQLITNGIENVPVLNNTEVLLSGIETNALAVALRNFLGNQWNAIENLVTIYSGVVQNTTVAMMHTLASVILSTIGQKVSEEGLSISALRGWLSGQKNNITGAVPSDFNLTTVLGLSTLGNLKPGTPLTVAPAISSGKEASPDNTGNKKERRWLLPLLGIITLGALIVYFMMSSATRNPVSAADTIETTEKPDSTKLLNASSAETPVFSKVMLPDSTKLQAFPGGIEEQLVGFIQTDEYKTATNDQLKEKWFNFDDLNFESGTEQLTPGSRRQLDNIVAILRAFKDVKIKIGAYADKKGNNNTNKKLSDARAKVLQKLMQEAGVGAQVPEAEGYGEKFATIDENATDEERKADRRISIRLIK